MVAKSLQLAALSLVLMLLGCETITTVGSHSGSEPSATTGAADAPVATTSADDVITQLQHEALLLQAEGQWYEAELKLERALRIDADKADIYHQLATVRMGQQRFAEAEQIALKGLSLIQPMSQLKAPLWQVIAQCRSAMGNITGAREAREEMQK